MATLTLGTAPGDLTLILNPGASFSAELDAATNGTPYLWPAGTTARLAFTPRDGSTLADWPGTVAGAAITFSASIAQVNAATAVTTDVRLFLNTGAGEFLWLSGSVVTRG